MVREKPPRPQPHTKDYRKRRNARNGRAGSPRENTPVPVYPVDTQTVSIIHTERLYSVMIIFSVSKLYLGLKGQMSVFIVHWCLLSCSFFFDLSLLLHDLSCPFALF